MLRKPKLRASPAMIVAILALIAALAGSAIASGGLTGTQKKQTTRIAKKVFKNGIGGASVAHAGSADTAIHASSADTARHASSADIAPNSVTGTEINQSTLTGVKAANVYSATFDTSLGCCSEQITRASDPGIKSDGCNTNACGVIFPRDVGNCSLTATITNASDTGLSGVPAFVETALLPGQHKEVNVGMFDAEGNPEIRDFALTVVCP
jgi:hypothetical protein